MSGSSRSIAASANNSALPAISVKGHNGIRVLQEEIFGPVVSVTTFRDEDEALHIANDTLYGLGAGVWSRDINTAYRFGWAIHAGRVWTDCYIPIRRMRPLPARRGSLRRAAGNTGSGPVPLTCRGFGQAFQS